MGYSQLLVICMLAQFREVFFVYDTQEVAAVIKKSAKVRGVTIKQMLNDCQLSINTLSSMQSGGYYPRLEAIVRIADYLDVSVDYLLGRTDKPEVNR